MRQICNLIRYLIVIILNVVVMLVFHSYVNFLLLVALIVFPFYSIFSLHQIKQNVSMEIMLPEEPMEKGHEFYLRLRLHNPTRFPLVNATLRLRIENGLYREEGTHDLNLPMRAKRKTEVSYPVVMEYCGRFKVCAEHIRLLDLLGIYEVTIPIKKEKECLVFPNGAEREQEAGRIYINGVSEAMESREKGYDFSEVSGIREYIPGDKLQNIYWKLSVKKEEWMVKERISVSAMQLNVLVELANDDEMRLDAVLELTDSVTKAFVKQNLPFTVYYYSTNLDELKDCYIGNEIERRQWLELLLYDQSYRENGRVEEMFVKQNPPVASYLYIGYAEELESEGAIIGEQQAAAVLRGERSN